MTEKANSGEGMADFCWGCGLGNVTLEANALAWVLVVAFRWFRLAAKMLACLVK